MAKRVFCIGNGESRKGFDLEKLRPHGKIYGCNALYRDFTPDHLSAVDMVIQVIVRTILHCLEIGIDYQVRCMKIYYGQVKTILIRITN
jgi:hypothetical protein